MLFIVVSNMIRLFCAHYFIFHTLSLETDVTICHRFSGGEVCSRVTNFYFHILHFHKKEEVNFFGFEISMVVR